jgi:UDP-glucuronate decarboxylase
MLELAAEVQRLVGSKLPLQFEPMPIDDPMQRQPNISKAKKYLHGWEPKVQLAEGLEKTIAFFRAQKNRH